MTLKGLSRLQLLLFSCFTDLSCACLYNNYFTFLCFPEFICFFLIWYNVRGHLKFSKKMEVEFNFWTNLRSPSIFENLRSPSIFYFLFVNLPFFENIWVHFPLLKIKGCHTFKSTKNTLLFNKIEAVFHMEIWGCLPFLRIWCRRPCLIIFRSSSSFENFEVIFHFWKFGHLPVLKNKVE
jgi:hypothetical protein